MSKWIFTIILVAGLYYAISGIDSYRSQDAAMIITAFAALYGLFMLGFFLRDRS